MKLGIVVNVLGSEEGGLTSYRLAATAASRGHDVFVMSSGNFAVDPDDRLLAHAIRAPDAAYDSSQQYARALKTVHHKREWITLEDLDVLLLRSNPAVQTSWAQHAAIHFSRLALRHGVIVLNDPAGLSFAMNKLYLQSFPAAVRPRTLITRNRARIRRFAREQGRIIVKPLQGYGGQGVFLVEPSGLQNLDEIIRAVARDGYVIAQEYLPDAAEGDTRLFLMNGVPLRAEGRYAAFRRVRSGDDARSNIHAGGRLRRAQVDDRMLQLAETVRPRLVEDGMFFVGLDIVGDKLLEINVFSPGGLGSAQQLEKVNFTPSVIESLEQKVRHLRQSERNCSNLELATL